MDCYGTEEVWDRGREEFGEWRRALVDCRAGGDGGGGGEEMQEMQEMAKDTGLLTEECRLLCMHVTMHNAVTVCGCCWRQCWCWC